MRGGALPPALLCAALAFALAFAPRRAIAPALFLLVSASVATSFAPIPTAWVEIAFLGCWASVMVTAASVHLPDGANYRLALALGINAGVWVGAVVAVAGHEIDLAKALPFGLLALPAAWLVATRRGIAVKVVASWLIAVAILAGALPLVPTPGYKPDHME